MPASFWEGWKKPEVDYIKGISPAIAIETESKHPQSSVNRWHNNGNLRLPQITVCPDWKNYFAHRGKEVKRDTVTDVVDAINKLNPERLS